MPQPWEAEREVSIAEATDLIRQQRRQQSWGEEVEPHTIRPLGAGWDNTAFVVNEAFVFRFPRKEESTQLLRTEVAVLPAIAPRLPLAIPVPTYVGRPSKDFPWPFAGYRMVAGSTACSLGLSDGARSEAAVPLGRFVAALHEHTQQVGQALGAALDTVGRLDMGRRLPQLIQRLTHLERLEVAGADFGLPFVRLRALAEESEVSGGSSASRICLVHGDLYARHLLFDGGQLCGVIDWGDVHIGNPANDFLVAWNFLPRIGRAAFRQTYESRWGPIDRHSWQLARFRAMHLSAALLVYGTDVGDGDLRAEGIRGLQLVLDG